MICLDYRCFAYYGLWYNILLKVMGGGKSEIADLRLGG